MIPIVIDNRANAGMNAGGIQWPGNGFSPMDDRMLAGQNKLAARADTRVRGFLLACACSLSRPAS